MSRFIKSHFTVPADAEKKVISIRMMETTIPNEETKPVFTHTEAERTQILREAELEAEKILAQALEEARLIKEQVMHEQQIWEQEKESLAEDARAIGYERGREEGNTRGYDECRQLIQTAQEVVEASRQDYYSHIESAEKVILDLGMKVAGKILGKKISENEEEFIYLVKRALKNARDYKDIQLHIHPNHYQYLLGQKEELIALFPKEVDFYIFPDEELAEDSCIIESENGRIDACVDSQLEEIKQKLFEMLESEQ
ncbi:flagellar assembly protein FliH [Bacillus sp. JJ1609]|uniref:flagellar assembly protein FliH n=1 Tax=Bacillus sp. JJ1609 TaxID=3122977 RepID=UPI002FFF22EB